MIDRSHLQQVRMRLGKYFIKQHFLTVLTLNRTTHDFPVFHKQNQIPNPLLVVSKYSCHGSLFVMHIIGLFNQIRI